MKSVKTFFGAFAVSMCVLGLGAGLLTVGCNSRRMAQGETAPHAAYRLQDGFLVLTDQNGSTVRLPVVKEEAAAAALVPAPVRGGAHLLRALAAAAERLADRLYD